MGGSRLLIAALNGLQRMQSGFVPALQNSVHVGPVHITGVQTGALIGKGNCLILKAHFQPADGIALLRGGQIAAANLQLLLQPVQAGVAHILCLDKGCRLLQIVDTGFRPGVGFLFNGAQ